MSDDLYVCVYGKDFKEDNIVLLEDFNFITEAIDWAKRYCSKEDMGNWDMVYVKVYYEVPGEVIPWSQWDDMKDPQVVWSCYQEPMPWSDNAMEEF